MEEALRKIQQGGLTWAQTRKLVDDALGDTYDERMVGTTTNSPIGCRHWFNTILGNMANIGEFMEHNELTAEQRVKWGKMLNRDAHILIDNYNKIPFEE